MDNSDQLSYWSEIFTDVVHLSYELNTARLIKFITHDAVDYIDIREVNTDEIGVWGRKGAALTMPQWSWLRSSTSEITKAVNGYFGDDPQSGALKIHLGGNMFVSVTSGIRCVDIRQWYMDHQRTLRAGRIGIALRVSEWHKFVELIPQMNEQSARVRDAEPCFHQNQEGAMECSECCPNGFKDF